MEPRFTLAYFLTDEFIIKGAGAITRQPSHLVIRKDIFLPTELWFSAIDSIKPSGSIHGILGFDFSFDKNTFLLTMEVFYNTTENLYEYKENIIFNKNIPQTDFITIGRSKTFGLDLFINKRIGNLTGWLGYTYSVSKRYFDMTNNSNSSYPFYERRHDLKMNVLYKTGMWEAGINWVYSSGQSVSLPAGPYSDSPSNDISNPISYYYTSRNNILLPSFHRLDINTAYKFLWGTFPCKIFMNIYNVYNRQNIFYAYADYKKVDGSSDYKPYLKTLSLFPIIPSLEFEFKF